MSQANDEFFRSAPKRDRRRGRGVQPTYAERQEQLRLNETHTDWSPLPAMDDRDSYRPEYG